jgi:hypothetical protein
VYDSINEALLAIYRAANRIEVRPCACRKTATQHHPDLKYSCTLQHHCSAAGCPASDSLNVVTVRQFLSSFFTCLLPIFLTAFQPSIILYTAFLADAEPAVAAAEPHRQAAAEPLRDGGPGPAATQVVGGHAHARPGRDGQSESWRDLRARGCAVHAFRASI